MTQTVKPPKKPKLVGQFIKQRRESLGISQRSLGLLFNPPVTTQFISNVERGVTPLPPIHVPTLCKCLQVCETEFTALLEKEYTFKLNGRVTHPHVEPKTGSCLAVADADFLFMRDLYEAFQKADKASREAFIAACTSTLNVSFGPAPKEE